MALSGVPITVATPLGGVWKMGLNDPLANLFPPTQVSFCLITGLGPMDYGGVPCAVRALCEKLAVLHHREFGKFRRLKGRH